MPTPEWAGTCNIARLTQDLLWVEGHPLHLDRSGECCADSSCCMPDFMWSPKRRAAYFNSIWTPLMMILDDSYNSDESDEPLSYVDVVIVPEGEMAGTWVRSDRRLTPHAERRLMEMVAGRQRVIDNARDVGGLPMKFGAIKLASKEKWAKAIGLAFVGQAVRVTL